jgi:hypothetical protein
LRLTSGFRERDAVDARVSAWIQLPEEAARPEEVTMTEVLYLLDPAGQYPRRVVAAEQLPSALAAAHQTGLVELELRDDQHPAPTHVELTTRYVTTDEFCGFHLYEAVVTLGGIELIRTTYAVPKDIA